MSDGVFNYPENCGIHSEGKGRQQQQISEEPYRPSLATVPPQSLSSLHSFPSQGWEHFVAPHGEIDIYIHCSPPSTGEKKCQIITADPTHSSAAVSAICYVQRIQLYLALIHTTKGK